MTAIVLLVFPIAIADFDYHYLLPVLPSACAAVGPPFAPQRRKAAPPQHPSPAGQIETTVSNSVASPRVRLSS